MSQQGIAALSPTDVWAVGARAGSTYSEHWNGTSWQAAPSANGADPDIGAWRLVAAAGSASDDVWAVGSGDNGDYSRTLIEHWDGSSWSMLPSPDPGNWSALTGVAAVNPSRAWAVGGAPNYERTDGVPVLLQWDGTSWSLIDLGIHPGSLQGVTAESATDAWAVGADLSGADPEPLVEHWDGSSWGRVPSPNLLNGGTLNAVSATSATDAWAVGTAGSQDARRPLIEHWNGSTWSIVASPAGSPLALQSVVALSPSDAWASGVYAGTGAIERWNGTSWSVVDTTDQGTLAASGPDDVWSAGGPTQIAHWNGSTWSPVTNENGQDLPGTLTAVTPSRQVVGHYQDVYGQPQTLFGYYSQWHTEPETQTTGYEFLGAADVQSGSEVTTVEVGDWIDGAGTHSLIRSAGYGGAIPQATSPDGRLYGAAADSPTDVWAVGTTADGRTLVQRFTGSPFAWSVVSSPNVGTGPNVLESVSAISPSDVWAVGSDRTQQDNAQTLIEHWDGSSWSVVPSPDVGSGDNTLAGVFAAGADDVWAVGSADPGTGVPQTLIEHWDGSSWSVTPSPDDGAGANVLASVGGAPGGPLWAVGRADPSGAATPLVLFWNGAAWHRANLVGPAASPGATLTSVTGDGTASIAVGSAPVGGTSRPFAIQVCPTQVFDDAFSAPPATMTAFGHEVFWQVEAADTSAHQIEDASGLGLFSSGSLPPGAVYGFTVNAAGTYPVIDPTNGATSSVPIPVRTPTAAHVDRSFTVVWAAHAPRPGRVFDVQIRVNGSPWKSWVTGTTSVGRGRTPLHTGTLQFRARLRAQGSATATGWSPPVTVTVA